MIQRQAYMMVKCLGCFSENVTKNGRTGVYFCHDCGRTFKQLVDELYKKDWTPLGIKGQQPPMTNEQRWNLVKSMRKP